MNNLLEDILDILVVVAVCLGLGLLLFIGVGCSHHIPYDGIHFQNKNTGCVSDLRGKPEDWCK